MQVTDQHLDQFGGDRAAVVPRWGLDDLMVFSSRQGAYQDRCGQEGRQAGMPQDSANRVRVEAGHADHMAGQLAQDVGELLSLVVVEVLEILKLVDDQQARLRGHLPGEEVAHP